MDLTPYQITYWNGETLTYNEVRPCCQEDNVVDYAIYSNHLLAYNITTSDEDGRKWVVSLKNADKDVDDKVIQLIGSEIDRHNSIKHSE